MGWFSNDSDQAQAYNEYTSTPHKPKLSHELISGAAAYEAAKAYENHVAKNGKPASHAEAKELLAAFSGAFIDREAETHGLNWIDKEKAKRDASGQAQGALQSSGNY
ncbi:putative phosphoglycerate mutase family protein [Auriscalpium vulgare]|uniref:Phosphoglycerate mutase family protein n=1 Tax=Auriscalpium vulgare TaxID=40419 RepID=A0ACB8R5L8_9AGAM|nr:putative phosphoglycerate mutase family protein [Auriscalpium vulgare]